MATPVAHFYGQFFTSLFSREITLTDTFKMALFTSTITIDPDNDRYLSEPPYTSNQVVGNRYTAGGITISPLGIAYNGSTNNLTITFHSMDGAGWVWWPSPTFTAARYAVIYSTSGNQPLVGFVDFGSDQSSDGKNNFGLQWASNELCHLTVA